MDGDSALYVQAVATIALVVVTALYVRLTNKLVKAQTASLPYMDIHLVSNYHLQVYVKNAGAGIAYNIDFEVENGFKYLEGGIVKSFEKFDTVVQLAPQQEKSLALISLIDNPDKPGSARELMNKVVKVKITYADTPQARSKGSVSCSLDFPYYLTRASSASKML
jgi:hypothetical protein